MVHFKGFIILQILQCIINVRSTEVDNPPEYPPVSQCFRENLKFNNMEDLQFIKDNTLVISDDSDFNETIFDSAAQIYAKETDFVISNIRVVNNFAIPVSNCLISTDGQGGSVGYSGSFGIGHSANIALALADPILGAVSLSGSLSVSLSTSFSISYSCSASLGGIAQLQASPIYVKFDFQTQKSYFNALNNEIVKQYAWSDVQSGSLPVIKTPIFRCVNGSAAVCGIPPRRAVLPTDY